MIRKRQRRVLGLLILLSAVLVFVGLPGRALWQEQQNQALIAAIKREDAPEAKRLLQKGADPNSRAQTFLHLSLWHRLAWLCSNRLGGGSAQNASDPSALACAIAVDNTEIARALLQHGAKILPLEAIAARSKRWQGDPEPLPLLLAAARSGNTDLVRLLLDCGARLDTRSNHGETVLTIAVDASPDHREEDVLARGIAPIVLRPVESQPYIGLVRFLLERGADPNTLIQYADPNALPQNHETAIERAAAHNQPEMVVDLLARGADPNRGVCDYCTALGFATGYSNLPMMRLLLAHGANVNPPGCDSPLTMAYDAATINLLLDHGADVNSRLTESSDAGDTALMGKVKQNQPDLVRLLVARGANVNAMSTWNGHTALILAATIGDAAAVRFLLYHGAHINAVNRFGQTALQEAMQMGNHDIVKLLLAHGAKVSLRNEAKEISAHGVKTLR